jgi:hypothetical protein
MGKLAHLVVMISATMLFLNIAIYAVTWIIKWPVSAPGSIPFPILLIFPLFAIWFLLMLLAQDYLSKNNITLLLASFYLVEMIFRNCPRLFFVTVGAVIFLIINIHFVAIKGGDPNHLYRVTASLCAAFYTFSIALSYAYATEIKVDVKDEIASSGHNT